MVQQWQETHSNNWSISILEEAYSVETVYVDFSKGFIKLVRRFHKFQFLYKSSYAIELAVALIGDIGLVSI